MKKSFAAALATSAVFSMAMMLPGIAAAQPGSRICGWTAEPQPGVAIGIVYEVRKADTTDEKQCDKVIDEVQKTIKKDATLSTYSWTKRKEDSCESVGSMFKSADHPNQDMCDYMEAKRVFQVMKKGPATTYTKMN